MENKVENLGSEDRYDNDRDLSPDSEQELLLFERRGSDDLQASMDDRISIHESGPGTTQVEGEAARGISLKKEITPLSGVGFVVGSLIGSGIFITPSVILNYSGSFGVSLVCWVFGAFVALAGALCYLELGMVVRKTGGEYAIFLEAYSFHKKNTFVEMLGSMVSFLYTWTSVLVLKSSSASIVTLTCARYLIRPFFIGCDIPENSVKLLALAIIIILVLVNCYSVRLTAYVSMVFSGLKVLAIIFIIGVGIITVMIKKSFPDQLLKPFESLEGHEPSTTSIAIALYGVLWAYDGWNIMNYAIEETKNIERTMSIALFVGIPVVALCYLLVNIAFFAVLSYEDVLGAEAVALPFGEATLGKAGLIVIPILVAFSTFGAANGGTYASSRSVYGAAKDHLLPDCLSGLHTHYRTPVPAILFLAVLSSVYVCVGNIGELIDSFAAASYTFYLLAFIALLILRITHPSVPRPFRACFVIPVAIFAIITSVFLITLPILQKPAPTLLALAAILLGIPVYVLFVMETPWRLRPTIFDKISIHASHRINSLLNTQSSRESSYLTSKYSTKS